MGHSKRNPPCKPCEKKQHKKPCGPCGDKKPHHDKKPDCLKCKEPECDCRCIEKAEQPLRVVEANFTPSTEPGIVASARFDLSNTPEYRPEWNVCSRRDVQIRVNVNLEGGTAPQALAIRAGVVYDTAPGDVYEFDRSDPFVVLAGSTGLFTASLHADLDKDRIVQVDIIYLTGVTPAPGAGVTYIPPVDPAVDIKASIYFSKKYPAKHQDPHKKEVIIFN